MMVPRKIIDGYPIDVPACCRCLLPVFRCSGVPVFRCSGVPVLPPLLMISVRLLLVMVLVLLRVMMIPGSVGLMVFTYLVAYLVAYLVRTSNNALTCGYAVIYVPLRTSTYLTIIKVRGQKHPLTCGYTVIYVPYVPYVP